MGSLSQQQTLRKCACAIGWDSPIPPAASRIKRCARACAQGQRRTYVTPRKLTFCKDLRLMVVPSEYTNGVPL